LQKIEEKKHSGESLKKFSQKLEEKKKQKQKKLQLLQKP
jgi:hypothetical protein